MKDEVNHLKRDMERQKTVLASMLRDKDEAVEKLYTVQTT